MKKLKHLVLAEGEVTGHSHKVVEGVAELYQDNRLKMLRAKSKVKIGHEEHKPIEIPVGDWNVGKVQEQDHFEKIIREVED